LARCTARKQNYRMQNNTFKIDETIVYRSEFREYLHYRGLK